MKVIYLSILVLLLSACSAGQDTYSPSGQLDLDLRSAPTIDFDISAERNSEAMRRFLMAELSLNAERTEDALDDLRASSKLIGSPQPQIQLNLAQLYISKGDLKQAFEELKIISYDPQAQMLQAAILQSLGHKNEALTAYRQLLVAQPQYVEANLMLALDALERKQTAEALTLLEKIISTDNKNLPALKLISHAYNDAANLDKSIQTLEQLRLLDPGDQHSLEFLLLQALESQRYEIVEKQLANEAKINQSSPLVQTFQKIDWKDPNSAQRKELINNLRSDISVFPTSSDIRYEMARFALLRQNFAEAVNHFSLLLAAKPENDELRYTLALALSSSGRVKEATNQLQQFTPKSAWFVKAQAFSGMLYKQRGDYKRAEESFRKALEADPKAEQLQFYLAATLQEAKKFDEAKAVFQDLLDQDPNNQTALFNYGALLHQMKNEEESHKIMQRLIAVNPRHGEALNFVSFDLAEAGIELDRALDLANRALQVQPENGFFLDTRGWVYFKMGRNKEAIADLERAVNLTKADAEIAEHLADVYFKVGRNKEALQIYKDALDNLVDSNEEDDRILAQRIRKKIDNFSQKDLPQASK